MISDAGKPRRNPSPTLPKGEGASPPPSEGGRGEVYLEFNHLLFNHYRKIDVYGCSLIRRTVDT